MTRPLVASEVAGRYTDDRSLNFDIYLPCWLAGASLTRPLHLGIMVFR